MCVCIVYTSMGAFTCFLASGSLRCVYSAMVDSAFIVYVCVWKGYVCVYVSVCACGYVCASVLVCACVAVCVDV